MVNRPDTAAGVIGVTALGTKVMLAVPDDAAEADRRLHELHEVHEMFLASRAIPKSGLCVDVGAGAGWFALPFAKAFPEWQVICFEPDGDSFELLGKNVARNGLENVTCVNAAFHPGLDAADLPRRAPGQGPLPTALNHALTATQKAAFQPLPGLGARLAPLPDDAADAGVQAPALSPDLLAALAPDLLKLDAPGGEQAIGAALRSVPVGFITGQIYAHTPAQAFLPTPEAGDRQYYLVAGEHALRRDYEDNFDTRQNRLDIVVAMYNCRGYIQECVDSLLADGNPDIRVLVVDDGSTDDSGALVTQLYGDNPRVRLLTKANGGCASARNFGRMHSDARHITFIDADDRVDPGMFSALLEVARYTGTFVVEGEFEWFTLDEDGNEVLTPSYEATEHRAPGHHRLGDLTYRWLPGDVVATGQPTIWRRVYRRDFLDRQNIWFPEHVRAFDDQIFQLLMARYCGSLAHVHGYAYHYRQHPGQDIKQGDERHFYSFNMFRAIFLRALDEGWDRLDPVFRSLLNTMAWSYAELKPSLKNTYLEAGSEFLAVVSKTYGHNFGPAELTATKIPGLELMLRRKLDEMRDTPSNYAVMRLESWRWQPEFIRMMDANRSAHADIQD